MKFRMAAAAAILSLAVEMGEAKAPNVILFMPDDIPFYWDEAPALPATYRKTVPSSVPLPWFEKVRAEGTVFDQSRTAGPMCAPSRYNLMTGRFCSRSEIAQDASLGSTLTKVTVPNCKIKVGEEATLPSRLAALNYTTIHSGKWHLAKTNVKGSDVWNLPYATQESYVKAAGFSKVAGVYMENLGGSLNFSHNNEWLVSLSVKAIEEAASANRPFFLYFAPTAPHSSSSIESALFDFDVRDTPAGRLDADPATTMPSRTDVWKRASSFGADADVVAGSIWVDDALGALYQKLDELDILSHTLIIVTMDHGMVSKGSLYESGTRTMLAARHALIPPSSTQSAIVSHLDVAATIVEAAGGSYDSTDGKSWWGLVSPFSASADNTPCAIAEINADRAAVAKDADTGHVFKYLRKDAASEYVGKVARLYPGYGEAEQLYDLTSDPSEQNNLASKDDFSSALAQMRLFVDCHDADTATGTFQNVIGASCDLKRMPLLRSSGASSPAPSHAPTAPPSEDRDKGEQASSSPTSAPTLRGADEGEDGKDSGNAEQNGSSVAAAVCPSVYLALLMTMFTAICSWAGVR